MSLYRIRDGVYAKSKAVRDEYDDLAPHFRALLLWFEDYVDSWLGGDVVYTSLYRDDPASSHAYGRAADVRIYHKGRGIGAAAIGAGLFPEDIDELMADIKTVFGTWKDADGDVHGPAIAHGDGLNFHLHLQAPPRPWS